MKNVLTRMAVMLAVASLATTTQAAAIYIDFSDTSSYAGGEQTTPVTRQWNTAALNAGITDLVDEDNNATPVDLVVTDDFDQNGGAGISSGLLVDWGDPVTQDNWTITAANGGQIRLEDLIAGNSYDLLFYGARGLGGSRNVDVTIDGSTQTYSSGFQGETAFASVIADVDGFITIDVATTSAFAHLSGLQITGTFVAIPEPSSFILAAIGLLGSTLIGRRRKR